MKILITGGSEVLGSHLQEDIPYALSFLKAKSLIY
jgi:hypothetical protein